MPEIKPDLSDQLDKDHDELRDKRTDLLNIRGILSPQDRPLGLGPVVPMPLGEDVAPAVEWLANEADRLRREIEELQAKLRRAEYEIRDFKDGVAYRNLRRERDYWEAHHEGDKRQAEKLILEHLADRDRARDIAVALEQQLAEIERIALGDMGAMAARRAILAVLDRIEKADTMRDGRREDDALARHLAAILRGEDR